MKRNFFNEPCPANLEELDQALMEYDMIVSETSAIITFQEDEGEYHGFSAELIDNDGNTFTTLGYESKEKLINDLEYVGIKNIDEE